MRKISFRELLPNIIFVLVVIAAILIFIVNKHPTLSEPWFTDESSAVSESAVSVREDNIGASNGGDISGVHSSNSNASLVSAGVSAVVPYSEKVNINTAGLSELMTLDGIGEVKARSIIEYRESHGYFSSIEELTRVSGIGSKTLEKNRDRITV